MGLTPLFVDKHATDGFQPSQVKARRKADFENVVDTCVMSPGMNLEYWDGWIPHGYIIHEKCRLLLDRLIPQAESNLELLLEICRDRYLKGDFDLDNLEILCKGRSTYLFFSQGPIDYKDVHLNDPLYIPAVRGIINHAMHVKRREQMKQKTRRWRRRDMCGSAGSHESMVSTRRRLIRNLSDDIVLTVLDQLDNPADLRHILPALNWTVPDTYWRGRLRNLCSKNGTPLLFEVTALTCKEDDMKEPDGSTANTRIHWKTLFLGMLRLMEEDLGVRNRMRIFRLIDKVRDCFESRERENQGVPQTAI